MISRSANLFVHSLFHLTARDCTSGLRLYRRHVVEGIPWERVRSTGYSFLVESLYWATRQPGVRVAEVPICFRDRERGKSQLGWREAVLGARNLIRLWVDVGRRQPASPADARGRRAAGLMRARRARDLVTATAVCLCLLRFASFEIASTPIFWDARYYTFFASRVASSGGGSDRSGNCNCSCTCHANSIISFG